MRRGVVALGAAAVVLPVLLYASIYLGYRIRPAILISEADASEAMRRIAKVVRGTPGAQEAQYPGQGITPPGPLWVTLYHRGELLLRHRAAGPGDLAQRLRHAVEALRGDQDLARLGAEQRRRLRIRLDVATAAGPLITSIPLLFAKSVVPGLDGLALEADGRAAYLLPDDMFDAQLMASFQPFFFMHEFRTGLDLQPAVTRLADELELSAAGWRAASKRYYRFRVQSFVDAPGDERAALQVQRSRVPVYRIDRRSVREAVVRAADYVLRQIERDGKFKYIYYPLEDKHSPPGAYSLPRHAGTTWFLSLAFRSLKLDRYRDGARRAIDYLGAHAVPRACRKTPYACVGSDHYADLGSAGLAVVAIAEYQRATGDGRFLPLARRLGQFITMMQKPNGDFCHQFNPAGQKKNCQDVLLYYTGEAALALAKLAQITGDRAYEEPLERALDFLTDAKYHFFMGQFFISEDHWTCIAAEAAAQLEGTDFAGRDQWAHFCYEFARLNGRAQVQPDEGLMADLHGAFTITPFFLPHNTPAGSRTEANVATFLLSQRRGEPQADVLRVVRMAIRYLVDQQIRPESSYLYPKPDAAAGGMLQTPGRASIRIDYVQHAAAALVRALPLIPEDGWSAE